MVAGFTNLVGDLDDISFSSSSLNPYKQSAEARAASTYAYLEAQKQAALSAANAIAQQQLAATQDGANNQAAIASSATKLNKAMMYSLAGIAGVTVIFLVVKRILK